MFGVIVLHVEVGQIAATKGVSSAFHFRKYSFTIKLAEFEYDATWFGMFAKLSSVEVATRKFLK